MAPTNWDELPLTLSVKQVVLQVVLIVGYGQARVRELCRAGIIPCIRLGRAYRIPRDSLKAWLLEYKPQQ